MNEIKTIRDVEIFLDEGINLQKGTSLYDKNNYTINRVEKFLSFIGNLEKNFRIYHIAGSKGKGTVAYCLARILKSYNYNTGLFVSPYVYDFRERFSCAGEFFKDESYINAALRFKHYYKSFIKNNDNLTVFEKYLCFAVILFYQENIQMAVFECGLGGRFDATNSLVNQRQILTSIELEHTSILGDSIEKIAVEKSKIIKKKSVVYAFNNDDVVNKIFQSEAANNSSKYININDFYKKIENKLTQDGEVIKLITQDNKEYEYNLSLFGEKFAQDSALALMTLIKDGIITDDNYKKALSCIHIPGRFEYIKNNSTDIVFDGAHTPLSIESTINTFVSLFKSRKKILIFGCAFDKDVNSICEKIADNFDVVILKKPGEFKKSDMKNVHKVFLNKRSQNNYKYLLYNYDEELDVEKLNNLILGESVLVCGSFYLLGEIKKILCINDK